MQYGPAKVANAILALANACEPRRFVTPLQLIKLVYVANGWSLGLDRGPLVNEPALAWTYGPVIPSLYNLVRQYRSSPIQGPLRDDGSTAITLDDQELIEAVYNAYGHLSGPQLSNMTHLPGSPWSQIWSNGAGQNEVIPNDVIEQHYHALNNNRAA